MNFDISLSIEILSSTPRVVRELLYGLSDPWTTNDAEDRETWQPFDVLGHLIHGEETDWIPRARMILAQDEARTFVPFDRFAQLEKSRGKSLAVLLDEFERLRSQNIEILRGWNVEEAQLDLEGVHPELGPVTLRQLLATWVVHDLNHIRQIVTAMAGKYEDQVGVWREYLSILK